jgi:nucleoid DNA-binding protein
MNRNGLIEALTSVLSTKKEAHDAIETIFGTIKSSLKNGHKVTLAGIGSFNTIIVRAKMVRNPKTGNMVNVPPRKKIRFKQSKDFFK